MKVTGTTAVFKNKRIIFSHEIKRLISARIPFSMDAREGMEMVLIYSVLNMGILMENFHGVSKILIKPKYI